MRTGLLLGLAAAAQFFIGSELLTTTVMVAALGLLILAIEHRSRIRAALRPAAIGLGTAVTVATVLLIWTGLVKVETLTKNRGYALLIIFIIAAVLTPPDAVSQCMMGIPMYLLYEMGIVFSRVLLKDKLAERAAGEQENAAS